MAGRESEITVWLNNKLGSTDDFWSGISISSRLTKDRLMSAIQYFRSLQAHVKVKLLLAFLHVPRRLRDEWRDDLDLLYKVACTDGDLWVSMVAEVLRTFPESGDLNLDVKEDHRSYHDMVNDLKKMVRQQHSINMLPMESSYLNRTSLNSLYPVLPVQLKHFAIKRKPKSAALRVETLQKSTDAAKKSISSFPVKMRSFAKKMDDDTPLKGLPNNTLTGSNLRTNSLLGRFSGLQGQKRELGNQKEGGIKLLDFDALPLSAKETRKRRKLELEQQKAAKKEEALAAATAAATSTATPVSSAMPDYAAGLLAVASFESLKSSQPPSEQSSVSATTMAAVVVTTAPTTASVPLLSPNIIISSANTLSTHQIRLTVLPVNTSTAQTLQQQHQHQQQQRPQLLQQQQFTPIFITQQNRPPMILTTQRLNQPSTILIQPAISSAAPTSLVLRPPGSLVDGSNPVRNLVSTRIKTLQSPQHQILSPPPQQQLPTAVTNNNSNNGINNASAPANEGQPKKELFLTREQVLKAQEMFTMYSGITRSEKALILGFMAGARENPCPNQGPVLNIRLGQTTESLPQPDGTFQPMVVDTYLQLNYSNGEFKKLQKIRGKDGGEGD